MIEKSEEKFQMGFRFYWETVCSHVSLLTTSPANKKIFKVSSRNTRKRCDIKNMKNTRKSNLLFAGNNCPGQLFLEYTPICFQKSAFNSYIQADFSAFQINLQNFGKLVVHLFKCGYSLYD